MPATHLAWNGPASILAARLCVAAVTLAAVAFAWTMRTGAVGGSDSACYAVMAERLAHGALQPDSPLARDAPWPDATRVAAPAGFLPSASRPGAAVPVCAPGYAALVAPFVWTFGLAGVYVVPPLALAALVWAAYLLACGLAGGDRWAGVAAAVLVAASPIVLFQAVQPMNDITTGALWLAVAAAMSRGRVAATGALVGVAVLVRPILAPAGLVAVLGVAVVPRQGAVPRSRVEIWRAAARAAIAASPGAVVALVLNALLYGAPLRSGYGDLSELFSWAHVPVNAMRFGATWLRTSTPLVLLAAVVPIVVDHAQRCAALACLALAAVLCAAYLAYRPFDEWWYLRFLLPAVALAATATAVSVAVMARAVAPGFAPALVVTVAALVAVISVRSPEMAEARRLHVLEARFRVAADTLATRFGRGAAAVTLWESGGFRFWPGNEVLVWDALDPAWLDRAVAWLETRGRTPVIVVERGEEAPFRRRFSGQTYGGLDWPPRYDVDRRVRFFVPSDRELYLRGAGPLTETVFAVR